MSNIDDDADERFNERLSDAMEAEREASEVTSRAQALPDDLVDQAGKLAQEIEENLANASTVEKEVDFDASINEALTKANALVGFLKVSAKDKALDDETRAAAKALIEDASDLVKTIKKL